MVILSEWLISDQWSSHSCFTFMVLWTDLKTKWWLSGTRHEEFKCYNSQLLLSLCYSLFLAIVELFCMFLKMSFTRSLMKHLSIKMCWWCFFYIIDYLVILCVGQQSSVWVKVQDGEDTCAVVCSRMSESHGVSQDASVQAKWWCQTETSHRQTFWRFLTWGQFCFRVCTEPRTCHVPVYNLQSNRPHTSKNTFV